MSNYYMDKLKRLSAKSYELKEDNYKTKSSGGRFYTKEDINLMPVDELKSKWNDINQQNKVYGIPSANQAKNYTQSGELLFINDTTPRYEINIDNSTNQPKLQQGAFKNGNFNNFQPEQNNYTNPLVNNAPEIINSAKSLMESAKQVNMPKSPNVQGFAPRQEEDPNPYHDLGPDVGKNFPSLFGDIFKTGTIENLAATESPEPEPTPDEEPKPEPTPDESKPTPSDDNNNGRVLKGRVVLDDGKLPPVERPNGGNDDDDEDEEDKKKPKEFNLLNFLATDGISLAKAIATGSGVNQVELFNDIKSNIGSSLKDYPEAQPLYNDVSDMRQAAYRQHVFEVNNMQEEAEIEKLKLNEMASKFYENYGTAETQMPIPMESISPVEYYRTPSAPINNNREADSFYQTRKSAPEPEYNYGYNPYTQYVYGYDDTLRQNYNQAFEAQRSQNSGYRPPSEPVFYPQTSYEQEPGFDFENYAKQQKVDEINAYHEALRQQYEQELQKELAKIWAGGALEIASAGIPVGGAMKIGSKVLAPTLTPALGRFLANRIAEGAAAGTLGGAVEGAGSAIRDGETLPDIAKGIALGALGGAAVGGATGGLFGVGKRAWEGKELKNYPDVKKLSSAERKELRNLGKKYYQNYVQQTSVNRKDLGEVKFYGDGLRETINQQPNNAKNFSDLKENIKKAKYVGEEVLNHPRRDGIIKFHRLRYKNEDYLIGETQSGDKIYHISKKSPSD